MQNQHNFRLGLLGHPVSHSKSPEIFHRFFSDVGIVNGRYELFDLADIRDFPSFIEAEIFRQEPLRGFNVTVPHKTDILPYLNELSAEARAVGAVNTVLVKQTPNKYCLIGHNTDVYGFSQSLIKAQALDPTPIQNAIIFGNGGSAKAVKYALELAQIPFHIWHRDQWVTPANNPLNPSEFIQPNTLFVHTTPLGMLPNIDTCIDWPWETIQPSHKLIDLVYNPAETKIMRQFQTHGAQVMNGAHMLQQQAVAAWTLFQENR
ncbi:MAG: shikimate dehydrogenase [Sphingomonadales bacterium]|nr:shikimate dehydrogenase [Sphingomonadales bacterium]